MSVRVDLFWRQNVRLVASLALINVQLAGYGTLMWSTPLAGFTQRQSSMTLYAEPEMASNDRMITVRSE